MGKLSTKVVALNRRTGEVVVGYTSKKVVFEGYIQLVECVRYSLNRRWSKSVPIHINSEVWTCMKYSNRSCSLASAFRRVKRKQIQLVLKTKAVSAAIQNILKRHK